MGVKVPRIYSKKVGLAELLVYSFPEPGKKLGLDPTSNLIAAIDVH